MNLGNLIKKPIDNFMQKYNSLYEKDKSINKLYNFLKCKKESNIERIYSQCEKIFFRIIPVVVVLILLAIILSILLFFKKSSSDDNNNIIPDDDNTDKEKFDEDNSITILYKKQIEKFENIRIFGDDFVESNLFSCKIYYNGKKYNLKNYFEIIEMNKIDTILKIYLTGINNIKDIKRMFKGYKALISLPDMDKLNTHKYY